ncbi:hypothetical protein G3570_07850 [Balneolaceae bacterium YR4-1]|uniref:Uncharacterized protein n=1 Tax=Halalkalibaculum roseum TaxID=2709311 RepID=A0A6M1SMJ2_9BACT|nr:hypothetical protein [Halalkalibaculum roseum]NGP76541.1 hypothetical protein [Halalkalibaculum roseum]
MKILAFSLILVISSGAVSLAQNPIEQKVFGYYQDGERLGNRKLLTIMEPYPDAYTQMRKAQNNFTAGLALSIPATLLLGGELIRISQAETFDDLTPSAMTYIGLPLSFVGSALLINGNFKRQAAVKTYNNSVNAIKNSEFRGSFKPVLKFTAGITGVGFKVKL